MRTRRRWPGDGRGSESRVECHVEEDCNAWRRVHVAGNNNKGQPTCVIWCVVALVYYLCRGGEYESSRCE